MDQTRARFAETHWSLVLPASNQQEPGAREALERLCAIYWPPIYGYLRGQGHSPEDAEDHAQALFAHLLSHDRLSKVQPARGRFRSFLLTCLSNLLHDDWDKRRAAKRGGGRPSIPLPLPSDTAAWEPPSWEDPARTFERQWASTLLTEVDRRLQEKYAAEGKSEFLKVLQPLITDPAGRGEYAAAAAVLQMSESATRTAVSRLRKEYRSLLRTEVARTVSSPDEIESEIRYLISVFQPGRS